MGILACMNALHPPCSARLLAIKSARRHKVQAGAGITGFLAVLMPVLMLGLGGVELAHWMMLRQTLSLALLESARIGATHQARPQAIADAFEYGLRMAYTRPESLARHLQQRRRDLGLPWQIRILQPLPSAFQDHADPDATGPRNSPGQALIRNASQALQHQTLLLQGWQNGRGPVSGLTIQEANTLVMDLVWPHKPMAPGLSRIIRALASLSDGDALQKHMLQSGYLPFRRRLHISMHSDPALWPALADGRVIYAGDASVVPEMGRTPPTNQGPETGQDTSPPPIPDTDSGPQEGHDPAATKPPGEAEAGPAGNGQENPGENTGEPAPANDQPPGDTDELWCDPQA